MSELRIHAAASLRCQNACLFCMEFDARTGRRLGAGAAPGLAFLTPERLLARLAPEHRSLPVLFTGGEPTLNPHLPDLIRALRERGFRGTGLQTNGRRLADPAFAIKLARAGLSRVSISLHGSSAAVHDAMTRAPGSWARTWRGLQVVLALKRRWPWLRVSTATTVAAPNLADLAPLLSRLLALPGLDVVVLNPLSLEGNAVRHFESLAVRFRDLAAAFSSARLALSRAGARDLERVTWTDFPPCVMGGAPSHVGTFERVLLIAPTGPARLLAPKLWFEGAKGPSCAGCARESSCTGVAPRYAARFGWEEFRAVRAGADG